MRLRVGIQPAHPLSDARSFVLERFPQAQRTEVEKVLERARDALRAVVADGIDKAMAMFN